MKFRDAETRRLETFTAYGRSPDPAFALLAIYRCPVVLCLFLLCLHGLAAGAQTPEADSQDSSSLQRPADFELTDEVVVVEKELLVEFPDLDRSALNLNNEDLWVSEDGQVREVLGVFPLPESDARFPVEVVFDGPLLSEETAALTKASMLRHAEELVALGPVRLWFLGDQDIESSSAVTSAGELIERLTAQQAIAGTSLAAARKRARRAAFLPEGEKNAVRAAASRTEERLVARSLARLTSLAVTGCGVPPCVLVLASDGFVEKDSRLSLVAPQDLAQLFSAYGWRVVSLALSEAPEKPNFGAPPNPATDFEEWTKQRGGVSTGRSQLGRKSRLANLDVDAYDVYVLPQYEALRDWARSSGGGIVARAHQVGAELKRFQRHYRLRYLSVPQESSGVVAIGVGFRDESPFLSRRRLARATGFAKEAVLLRAPEFGRSGWPGAEKVWLWSLVMNPSSGLP